MSLCHRFSLSVSVSVCVTVCHCAPLCVIVSLCRKIVHFVAFLWVLYTVVAFCLPTTFPITGEDWENNFNWAPVAIISCLILLTVWWVLDARFWFRGPLKAQHLGDDLDATEGDVHKENVEVDFFES